jgi:hypothetical protein
MYPGILLRLSFVVGLASALFVITFFQPGGSLGIWTLRVLWITSIVWFLLAPALEGLQVAARVREGVLGTADVLTAQTFVGRHRLRRVEGRRVVHHPILGDFTDEFSIAAPWIGGVTPRSEVDVLLAPAEQRTWLSLGIHGHSLRGVSGDLPEHWRRWTRLSPIEFVAALLLMTAAWCGVLVAIAFGFARALDLLFPVGPAGPVGPRIVAAASPPSRPITLRHPGLYFIADGPIARTELEALAAHFEAKLHLRAAILPSIRPSTSVVDSHRHQLVSEKAIDEVTAHLRAPGTFHVLVLAITPYDAYPSSNPSWHFTFGIRWKQGNHGAGLISTARMTLRADLSKRRRRLRTMVARYIGEAYFGLPRNDNRRSALYKSIRGTADLDGMTEELCPADPGAIKSC